MSLPAGLPKTPPTTPRHGRHVAPASPGPPVTLTPLQIGAENEPDIEPPLNVSSNVPVAEQRAQATELELEQQRIDLERQRLELERRRITEEERAEAVVPAPVESPSASVLLVFGGRNHKVFLGCLCDDAEEDSVFNEHGKYGQYGLNLDNSSLWSVLGGYRGVVGDYTACGMFTKDPPIVVTPQGQAICRLTTDDTNQYQCKAKKLIDWLKHGPCGQP